MVLGSRIASFLRAEFAIHPSTISVTDDAVLFGEMIVGYNSYTTDIYLRVVKNHRDFELHQHHGWCFAYRQSRPIAAS